VAVSAGDVARDRAGSLPELDPHVIVLFGGTGDLGRRKLIPGLFDLGRAGLLPERVPHSRHVAGRHGRRGLERGDVEEARAGLERDRDGGEDAKKEDGAHGGQA
jgi:glucose-6-phosphate 1-dehydrogenase